MDKKPPQSEQNVGQDEQRLERLFDAHEVAEQCKVSEKSLHKWAREGRIPAVKFGRLWRFRKSAIDAFLDHQAAS
ncbi:MAG TPA: helix-turn-helix domain-containing protein [Candidatus Aquilonibacter sp.]|nr:helix-turn-helix domain-containing protein [Candidatus Aquilonibacter sp.]